MNTASRSLKMAPATLALMIAFGLASSPTANATLTALAYRATTASGNTRLADDRAGGRLVEVVGDIATADHIAVVVPGVGNSIENFGDQSAAVADGNTASSVLARARAIRDEVLAQDPTAEVAAIAWLGYVPPAGIGIEALDQGPARTGAEALKRLRAELPRNASVTWVCHSYGTVVCAEAASSNTADQIVLLASPGIEAETLSELNTSADVWTARNEDDPVRYTQLLNVFGIGYGSDPAREDFGANTLDTTTDGGHQGYFRVGGVTLKALAQIVIADAKPLTQASAA